jgi:hypothetical protein
MSEIKPIEIDWKRAFYSLALRVISAQGYLALKDTEGANRSLAEAVRLIAAIDKAPHYVETDPPSIVVE